MTNWTRRSLMTAAVTGVVGASAASGAMVGPHEFELQGSGIWDDLRNAFNPAVGANMNGMGRIEHIGKVRQAGNLFLNAPDAHGIAAGSGSVTLTTASGLQIFFAYSGLLDTIGGIGLATVKFTGGTGKFASAYGIASLYSKFDLHSLVNAHMKVVKITGTLIY